MDHSALAVDVSSFWSSVLGTVPNAVWQADVRRILIDAEGRREAADYDTGSITEQEAYALVALAEGLRARIVIEVGTFIGTSTCALASASSVRAVFTCDASNDCLKDTDKIRTFPKQTSNQMLRSLKERGVIADLCFFDGVLNEADIAALVYVTSPRVVFAMHDHNYGPKIRKRGLETMPRKGIGNARLLRAAWPHYALVEPLPETTLALLVPESML